MYVKNAWYVAAWSHELGRSLLARRICGEPIVFYRRADGAPAALIDRCRHRLVPLSMGALVGDEVHCGYHGFRFSADGKCTHIPSQEHVGANYRVRTFPVVERHGFIWVWPGDEASADASAIPNMYWNDDPAWTGAGNLALVNADYRLVIDNLLDLTHEAFLHPTSIGSSDVAEAPCQVDQDGDRIRVSRWIMDHEPAPAYARYGFGRVDRWQIVNLEPPTTIWLDVGVAPTGTGAPQGDRSKGVTFRVLHMLTPETERSTWYFNIGLRAHALDDAGMSEGLRASMAAILKEDLDMLNAQQRAVDENPACA